MSIYEQRLRSVLDAVQDYLPTDGTSAHDTLNRIIGLVDPWPAASPQAAQPAPQFDEWRNLIDDLEYRARFWRQPGIGDFPVKDAAEDFAFELDRAAAALRAHPASPAVQVVQPAQEPIDMVLHCPKCGMQHVDAPESHRVMVEGVHVDDAVLLDNPPHKSHLCHGCGHVWRPADVPTNGVAAVKTKGRADSPIAAPQPAPAQPPASTFGPYWMGECITTTARLIEIVKAECDKAWDDGHAAQPTQEVRMLTEDEIWDSECGGFVATGKAIQRKFCEKNNIKLRSSDAT